MILNDVAILNHCAVEGGKPWITPFNKEQVNGNSYDVTLAAHFISPEHGEVKDAGEYQLNPGEVVLASTVEIVDLPSTVAAYLSLKSSIARQWINHAMAGWIYPKFNGNITLELMNVGVKPFIFEAGMRIAQLTFQQALPPLGEYQSTLPKHEGTVAVPLERQSSAKPTQPLPPYEGGPLREPTGLTASRGLPPA